MKQTIQYTSIHEVLSRVLRHPLMAGTTMDDVIFYLVDFIGIFGMPMMYESKEIDVEVKDYRAQLPSETYSVTLVKDSDTNYCLRSTTDMFNSEAKIIYDKTYKVQGNIIVTNFETGMLHVLYEAIPVDEDGIPMVIANIKFLNALTLYIIKEKMSILFDTGSVNANVYEAVNQRYSWAAGQLQSEFSLPSYAEMESLKNMYTELVQKTHHFDTGFKDLGNKNAPVRQ